MNDTDHRRLLSVFLSALLVLMSPGLEGYRAAAQTRTPARVTMNLPVAGAAAGRAWAPSIAFDTLGPPSSLLGVVLKPLSGPSHPQSTAASDSLQDSAEAKGLRLLGVPRPVAAPTGTPTLACVETTLPASSGSPLRAPAVTREPKADGAADGLARTLDEVHSRPGDTSAILDRLFARTALDPTATGIEVPADGQHMAAGAKPLLPLSYHANFVRAIGAVTPSEPRGRGIAPAGPWSRSELRSLRRALPFIPLLLGAGPLLATAWGEGGVSFSSNDGLWRAVAAVATLGTFLSWELLRPLRRPVQPKLRHYIVNIIFGAVNIGVILAFLAPHIDTYNRFLQTHGIGLLPLLHVTGWANVLLSLLALDLASYWWHWGLHQRPALWRFHKVHHSDLDLDVGSNYRTHLGEMLLELGFRMLVYLLLGPSLWAIAAFEIGFIAIGHFEHANIRIPEPWESWLRSVVVTPGMHHHHHSNHPAQLNTNYSNVFSFWDRLFKTYDPPEQPERIVLGLKQYPDPEALGLAELFLMPLGSRRAPRLRSASRGEDRQGKTGLEEARAP